MREEQLGLLYGELSGKQQLLDIIQTSTEEECEAVKVRILRTLVEDATEVFHSNRWGVQAKKAHWFVVGYVRASKIAHSATVMIKPIKGQEYTAYFTTYGRNSIPFTVAQTPPFSPRKLQKVLAMGELELNEAYEGLNGSKYAFNRAYQKIDAGYYSSTLRTLLSLP
jgi:hypothetical protein